jgi:hypothetical protein
MLREFLFYFIENLTNLITSKKEKEKKKSLPDFLKTVLRDFQ